MRNLRVKSFIDEVFKTYSNYFGKVYSYCILITSIVFIIIALLLKFSSYGPDISEKWFTFYHALFYKYSEKGIYSIVDLSKSIYLFFAMLLALSLYTGRTFRKRAQYLNTGDISISLIALLVAVVIDVILYFVGYKLSDTSCNADSVVLVRNLFFELRIYFPILIFAFAVSQRVLKSKFLFNWYGFLTLIISSWLFNEFAYELSLLVKNYILTPITINFNDLTTKNLIESILCIPLFAIFLLGFACVLFFPLSFYQKQIQVIN